MCARAAAQKRLLEVLKAQGFMGTARLALRKLRVAHKLESNSIDSDEVKEVTDAQAADAQDVLDLTGASVAARTHACLHARVHTQAAHAHVRARTGHENRCAHINTMSHMHRRRYRLIIGTHAGKHGDEDAKGKQPAHDDWAADGSHSSDTSNAREACLVSVRCRDGKKIRMRILTTHPMSKVRNGASPYCRMLGRSVGSFQRLLECARTHAGASRRQTWARECRLHSSAKEFDCMRWRAARAR